MGPRDPETQEVIDIAYYSEGGSAWGVCVSSGYGPTNPWALGARGKRIRARNNTLDKSNHREDVIQ
eukprot:9180083-Pyramimonas_sp.AAC.1